MKKRFLESKMKGLIAFCLLLIISQQLFAQQKETKRDVYPIYLNYEDRSIRADVLAGKVKVKPKTDKSYFWYSSNKILETKGGFDGKLLHGQYQVFYPNNNLKEKGQFKKGLKEGKWTSWYPSGKIMEITEWEEGKRDGERILYNEGGDITLTEDYDDDKLNGLRTVYEGKKVISEKKYKNGIEQTIDTKKQGVKPDNEKSSKASKEKKSLKEKIKSTISKVKFRKKPKEAKPEQPVKEEK